MHPSEINIKLHITTHDVDMEDQYMHPSEINIKLHITTHDVDISMPLRNVKD